MFYQVALANLAKNRIELEATGKCINCFLPLQICICSRIRGVFEDNLSRPKARFEVFMHNKEWGRGSNTGKLLTVGLPQQSNMYIFGDKDSQTKLSQHLSDQPSLILYPSKSSEPISNYVDWYNQHSTVNLCVLDSTWSQSLAMDRALPSHIPRVRVDDFVSGSSQFLNRKQSDVPGRVSTLEAVAIALQALGEPEAVIKPLYDALHISVDAMLRIRGHKTAYGNNFVGQIATAGTGTAGADGVRGPFSERIVARPERCPQCSASKETTIFRNLGVRKPPPPAAPEVFRVWQCLDCNHIFKAGL
jgi:DTW domain-containing protein YfiP